MFLSFLPQPCSLNASMSSWWQCSLGGSLPSPGFNAQPFHLGILNHLSLNLYLVHGVPQDGGHVGETHIVYVPTGPLPPRLTWRFWCPVSTESQGILAAWGSESLRTSTIAPCIQRSLVLCVRSLSPIFW